MKLEGGLQFDLYHDGSRVVDVQTSSARPLQMVKVLKGKSAEDGLALLGMLYRICNVAQRYAGLSAWRNATGVVAVAEVQQAQQLLVNLETVREHLWQLLVAWPELLNIEPQQRGDLPLLSVLVKEMENALFKEGNGMSPTAQLAIDEDEMHELLRRLLNLVEQQVCGIAVEQWLEIESLSQLLAWANRHETQAARSIRFLIENDWQALGATGESTVALPVLTAPELKPLFNDDGRGEFIAHPTWQGLRCESNAYTRQRQHKLVAAVVEHHGDGLLARVTARLVELAGLAQQIRGDVTDLLGPKPGLPGSAGSAETGQGVAMIEAARGRLLHWLRLEQGVIGDYAILAPTEWNFHPNGVAVQGLMRLPVESEERLKQQAALWINAIDPCVAYELRVHRNA